VKPLAIFGGTFDPVHLGHLSVAWEASELLDAEVRLMPASVPPHRPAPIASAQQRAAMLHGALQGQSRLSMDTRELERSGPSYTIDTLIELRAEQGDRPLVLLIGADAFAGLPSWHRWRELFEVAHIGVLSRPGVDAELPDELEREVAGRRVDEAAALRGLPAGTG
jgi:nicotinate-nucleotide adenylyltransferase